MVQNKFNEASAINKQIILMWILVHIGIKKSETADQQAEKCHKKPWK